MKKNVKYVCMQMCIFSISLISFIYSMLYIIKNNDSFLKYFQLPIGFSCIVVMFYSVYAAKNYVDRTENTQKHSGY